MRSVSDMIIRADNTRWSLGSVDFNEIGSSVIVLPRDGSSTKPIVLNVDVRLSTGAESTYIVIAIWKSSIRRQNSPLSLRNETCQTLYIQQTDVSFPDGTSAADFTLTAPPFSTVPVGWVLSQASRRLRIGVAFDNDANSDGNSEAASEAVYLPSPIDVDLLETYTDLGMGLFSSVDIWGPGKVIIISAAAVEPKEGAVVASPVVAASTLSLLVDIHSLSLSVIAGNTSDSCCHIQDIYMTHMSSSCV